MLKAGIVGLPNVGKSTLFNAVTRSHKAVAENYPFCTTELVLADIDAVKKRHEKISKDVKRGDKHAILEAHLLDRYEAHLNSGKPANTLPYPLSPEEKSIAKTFFLLTDKPTVFAANVKETDLATAGANPHVSRVREYARAHHACETIVICAQLESDLADLSTEEGRDYLKELG